jgi:outer membrane biosynthesis protein TonB
MDSQLIGRHLMEAAPRPRRGARPFFASVGTHGVLIAFAVLATLHPDARPEDASERVEVVDLSRFAPPSPTQLRARRAVVAQMPARGFQVVVAPAEVPLTLPTVEATKPVTIPEDFSAQGVAGGFATGVGAALLPPTEPFSGPIDGAAADEPPYLLPGQMGPAYPEPLRDDRPDGLVVVRFVIDTLGHVEFPSIKVVEASHPLFLSAVRVSLERLRFLPGHFSGKRVRVQMEQRFEFHLASP